MTRTLKLFSGIAASMLIAAGCYAPQPDPVASPETTLATPPPSTVIAPTPTTTVSAPEPVPTTAPAPTTTTTTTPPSPPAQNGLDSSGQTIPDTNYPIPSGAIFVAPNGNDANPGTQAAPVKSLRRAVSLTPENGTVVLRGGEHRTWYSNSAGSSYDIVAKNLTFQAFPHEQPWLNGADVVSDWTNAGNNRWTRSWSTPSFCDGKYYNYPPTAQASNNSGPCTEYDMAADPAYRMAGDPQMVFIDGANKRQVATLAEVNANTFHYDWNSRVLTIGMNPSGRVVEAAARPVAMVLGNNKNYTLRGIGFHRYASNQYSNLTSGAVYIGGTKTVIENVVFSHNAGTALTLSAPRPGSVISRSVFAFNGALGLGSNGSSKDGSRNDLTIEKSIFSGNNFEFYGAGCRVSCAAANIKLARMVGFVVKNNVIENAFGPEAMGLWCDINCSDATIVNNVVRNNGAHGIFYEISRGGIIASNLVVNNGSMGILVGSATTKIYNNTVVTDANRNPLAQGIRVFDDERWPNNPPETGPNTTGIAVVNNVISGPKGMLMLTTDGPGANNTQTGQFFTAFDYNSYHHGAGEKFINWAHPNPSIGKYLTSVADLKNLTGWDSHGLDVAGGDDPFFANKTAGDYRARTGGSLQASGAPLPTDVANAIGVPAGVAVNRGALTWPSTNW